MLEHWLGGGSGGSTKARTFRWLILLGLIGAALMILNSFSFKTSDLNGNSKTSSPPSSSQPVFSGSVDKEQAIFTDYEHDYETELKDILQNIVGVGAVDVFVTVDSSEEITVDKNDNTTQQVTTEKDQNGATRNTTENTHDGQTANYQSSGDQSPFVLKYTKPTIRGVVVVAAGAENLQVKKLLIEAVERGLNVPLSRISVLPRKQSQ